MARPKGRTRDFSARLNEADAMFTTVSEASGVPYAPVSLSVLSNDFANPEVRPFFRERRSRLLPATRRRIVRDRFSIALPRWVEVPGFDMSDNQLFLPPPGDGSLRAILDWAARWAVMPFPPDKPPWRSVFFKDVVWEGVPGRVVMLSQQHHAVIDGGGSLVLNERFRQPIPEHGPLPELPPPVPFDTSTAFERWKEGWALEAVKAQETLRNGWTRLRWAASDPPAGLRRARELVGAMRRMQSQQSTSTRSPLLKRRSDDLRFDWLTVDLAGFKAGAKAAGGTFNDAFMAAVGVGLHAYHRDHGIQQPSVRAAMAVNRRKDDGSYVGNVVIAVTVDLPLGTDASELTKASHEVARAHLDDHDVLWLLDRFRALANRLPRRVIVPITRKTMAGYDVQMSSIAGPSEWTPNAGVHTLAATALPIGPSGLTLTFVSGPGVADLGITSDRASIPDPEHLVACLRAGFDAVIALGR